MKTLILCVDRDDDLGIKGGVATPVIGRRRCVEAATALGLADPEDSDTNALFAAVKLCDEELRRQAPTDQVEVACIAGHKALGLQADRKLAQELKAVLETVRPDGIVLVSDGAEDEQIVPILNAHSKVVHVHRSIVKQAPRLEGFYYVLTRLLDDEKQAKRFVLPFALVLMLWGIAYLVGLQAYAWGATLAVVGLWLTIHAMQWEDRVGRFLGEMGTGLREGKLAILATAAMAGLLLYGVIVGLQALNGYAVPAAAMAQRHPYLHRGLVFSQAAFPWFIAAMLVQTAGSLFDAWVREGRAGVGHWTAAFLLIALGFIGLAAIPMAIDYLEGRHLLLIVTLPRMVFLVAGSFILMMGIIVNRYVRAMVRPQARGR